MPNKKVGKINEVGYYLVAIYGDVGHHIFIEEADNIYFLSILEKLLIGNKTVEIVAYCLKLDQIVLLSNQIKSGGATDLMHNVIVSYNKYYFDKYAVEGVLSESGYIVSKVFSKDILKVSCKIHTNLDDWVNYEYSSLRAYLYNDTPDWLTKGHIANLYGSAVKYFDLLNSCDKK